LVAGVSWFSSNASLWAMGLQNVDCHRFIKFLSLFHLEVVLANRRFTQKFLGFKNILMNIYFLNPSMFGFGNCFFWVWCLVFFGSLGLSYGYGLNPKKPSSKPNKTQTKSSAVKSPTSHVKCFIWYL
jgi:hypothetical protein